MLNMSDSWANQDHCFLCSKSFLLFSKSSVITGRHHCRDCGQSVCDGCSNQTRFVSRLGIDTEVRACDVCAARMPALGPGQYKTVADASVVRSSAFLSLGTPQLGPDLPQGTLLDVIEVSQRPPIEGEPCRAPAALLASATATATATATDPLCPPTQVKVVEESKVKGRVRGKLRDGGWVSPFDAYSTICRPS
jgi:hypothetical protein